VAAVSLRRLLGYAQHALGSAETDAAAHAAAATAAGFAATGAQAPAVCKAADDANTWWSHAPECWWTCAFTCGVYVLHSFVFWQLMDKMVQVWACGLTVSYSGSYEQIRDRCVNPTQVYTELIAHVWAWLDILWGISRKERRDCTCLYFLLFMCSTLRLAQRIPVFKFKLGIVRNSTAFSPSTLAMPLWVCGLLALYISEVLFEYMNSVWVSWNEDERMERWHIANCANSISVYMALHGFRLTFYNVNQFQTVIVTWMLVRLVSFMNPQYCVAMMGWSSACQSA